MFTELGGEKEKEEIKKNGFNFFKIIFHCPPIIFHLFSYMSIFNFVHGNLMEAGKWQMENLMISEV